MEVQYFVHNIEVTREEAFRHWRQSGTYRRARFPDALFANAEAGSTRNGEVNHLREANIRIEILYKEPQCPTP